jgi:hypothetical protein
MKRYALLLLVLCSISEASELTPVVYSHTATTQEVFVACYWAQQFPRFSGAPNNYLLLACPKATWQAANPAKKNAILTTIRRWLSGDLEVSAERVADLKTALADNNIGVALTNDPRVQLTKWGLQ